MHNTSESPPHPNLSSIRVRALVLCAVVSLAGFVAERFLSTGAEPIGSEARESAVRIMGRALDVLRDHRERRGIEFDAIIDPNKTALIGEEYTPMTTTLGSVEAKRTTTNPAMAGVIVQLLEEAGVVAGDTIAVGCSGSFPALAIAVSAASEALGATPVMIASLGSSSYGATDPAFTILDILSLLHRRKAIGHMPAAVSLGGADDAGNEFEPEIRRQLIAKINASGLPLVLEPDLRRNVEQRMSVYFGPNGSGRIAAFVNIGGNYADLGTNPLILKLEPGVNKSIQLPEAKETYGVVFAMANRHIPVVHLLHIKGLALKYGLPWDPVPFPGITEKQVSPRRIPIASPSGLIILATFAIISLIFFTHRHFFFRTHS